ncbi:MAG: T9SS type A sorting domain-containing protein, partial [Bacteroidales bacterium]|nr:T9SS type A sorting domain-containing protein [Bacteroidales bacterium]
CQPNNSFIMHTADGGTTWEEQTSGTSSLLSSVCFTDAYNGWASGDDGTIIYTVDGGTTWETQSGGTNKNLSSVFFTDSNNGWIVGDYGTVLHTDNGGIVTGEEYRIQESEFRIQNYPNPFTCFTTIEYELSEPGSAEIKIYNQAGQLIKEFVQQKGQVGLIKVAWQAENMPSGIYFIRLQVGNEIITKKMIKLN